MPRKFNQNLVKISVKVPEPIYQQCQQLLQAGFYDNMSQLIRHAIIILLQQYGLKPKL